MLRNQIENSNIDVFTISESWLSAAVPDRVIECMNYNVIRLDRSWNDAGDDKSHPKRGGGLVSFVKSNMKYSDTKYEKLNVSCKDVEMMWIALDITNVRPIVIVTVYRPPQGDSKRCTTFINEAIERANLKDNTDIFLLGDFNISFLSDTKKIVFQKLFNLRKLRYFTGEKGAISIYKQTILPMFDYAGFILIACTKSDRYDLQVLQNDALRTCYNVKRRDKLSILKLHKKANLLSLEQRRIQQLLYLMYLHKQNPVNLKPIIRNTRAADRDQFHVERYSNYKYQNSPFYKGVEIWNKLPNNVVACDSICKFKMELKRMYKQYDNTLT